MTYKAIDVFLYRCNKCHAVQAARLVKPRGDPVTNEAPMTYSCGCPEFTRINIVG